MLTILLYFKESKEKQTKNEKRRVLRKQRSGKRRWESICDFCIISKTK